MGANVGYTCNDIDSVQQELKLIIDSLEDLRQANIALRDFGDNQEARADDFEEQLNQLRDEYNSLESEYMSLEERFKNLQDELNNTRMNLGKY
jgi:chromosome segregation ATPase